MITDDTRRKLRALLDTAEDYYRDGFRRTRPETVELPASGASSVTAREPGVGGVPPVAAPIMAATVSPPAPGADGDALERLNTEVTACDRCALCGTRRNAVPGEGVPNPAVLVVGEGPGADEDATGRPFVGAAGKYLDKWLTAVGLDRATNCYIANVVKCRPPGNRDPRPEEIEACRPYLERQVDLLRPRIILTVGRFAAQTLTGATQGITALRGTTRTYRGIPLVATFHPSAVLRDPSLRGAVWEDLKRLKTLLEHG